MKKIAPSPALVVKIPANSQAESRSFLVVHPKDESTTFLESIYKPLTCSKKVIQSGTTAAELENWIRGFDTILMCGHGFNSGLLSVGQFPSPFIIDQHTTEVLREKKENIFIWCYASLFVREHRLSGFCTEMYISELNEAHLCQVPGITPHMISESNECFVKTVSRHIEEGGQSIFLALKEGEYKQLTRENPIAKFNYERFHLFN